MASVPGNDPALFVSVPLAPKPSGQDKQQQQQVTLEELKALKEAQAARAKAQQVPIGGAYSVRQRPFKGLDPSDEDRVVCGHLLCCWGSQCCRDFRRDLDRACASFMRVLKTGQALAAITCLIFILAWAIFIGGMVWSKTYYDEYYCNPAIISNNGTGGSNLSAALSNGSKINVAGYRIPIPPEDNPCMPQYKPEKKHFPMKFSHWIPGIIISLAYCCMGGFTFRDVRENDIEIAGVDKTECDCYLMCCKSLLMMCTVVWAAVGLLTAFIYLILMVSFVDELGDNKKHVAVPTICVLIQCTLLVFGLITGFVAKWRSVRGEVEDEDHLS
jgi:hypothetical protein